MFRRVSLTAAIALSLTAAAGAVCAEQAKFTWIFVDDMHCEDCAMRVRNKLYNVPGVVKVQTHVKKKFAVVTPKPGTKLSPRALWVAVEKSEFTPVKLYGPNGVYKKKPSW